MKPVPCFAAIARKFNMAGDKLSDSIFIEANPETRKHDQHEKKCITPPRRANNECQRDVTSHFSTSPDRMSRAIPEPLRFPSRRSRFRSYKSA